MIFLARKQGAGHNDPSSSLAVLHPSWREQLPFQGKVAEAEAGCEEMLMPSGSEISLPACLTISPKRMQVPRAGVDKTSSAKDQRENNFSFWGHAVPVATTLPLWQGSSHRRYENKRAGLRSNKTLFIRTSAELHFAGLPQGLEG